MSLLILLREFARASALASKWSALQTQEENRYFNRQFNSESCYDPYEDCECDHCLANPDDCGGDACQVRQCRERRDAELQAERDLEIELVEDKLHMIGARMMRPYEHWNEEERYMEYMENLH